LPVEFFARVLSGEPIWLPLDGSDVPCSPISTEDVAGFLPGLWDVASTSTTIVNLAGDEATSVTEFMSFLGERAGRTVDFVRDERSRASFVSDNTHRKSLLGGCSVNWREGMVAAVESHYPGAFDGGAVTEHAQRPNIWDQS
jgi:hypothetical protein